MVDLDLDYHHTDYTDMDSQPAGKLIPRGHTVSDCMIPPSNKPETPENLRRIRQRSRPDVGQTRSPNVPESIQKMEHGMKSKPSLNASDLINPPPLTLFQAKLTAQDESIYSSHVKSRLGKGPADVKLPSEIDTMKQTFGLKTVKGDAASMLVSPPKSRTQVEEESAVGKELYKRSHRDFDVGEMIDREYDWSVFSKDSEYGVSTPHDNTGKQVKLAMDWQRGDQITSKQLDDFRERTHPQLGSVHDPIADSMKVSDDHTFGIMVDADEYNAGHLLHSLGPSIYLECKEFDKGLLATIRNHLNKHRFTDFDHLLDGFQKLSLGDYADKKAVLKLLFEFRVPLEPGMVHLLIQWCSKETNKIDYNLLLEIINWKRDIDIAKIEQAVNDNMSQATIEDTDSVHDEVIKNDSYKTSTQQSQAVLGEITTRDYKTFGTPTIRVDRPPPRIRRVADLTNYGDESDAHGVMYPSIYSLYGVYEQDFFTPLAPDQIRQIFSSIGIEMSDEQFKTNWEKAAGNDANGQVSIESFRQVLRELKQS